MKYFLLTVAFFLGSEAYAQYIPQEYNACIRAELECKKWCINGRCLFECEKKYRCLIKKNTPYRF